MIYCVMLRVVLLCGVTFSCLCAGAPLGILDNSVSGYLGWSFWASEGVLNSPDALRQSTVFGCRVAKVTPNAKVTIVVDLRAEPGGTATFFVEGEPLPKEATLTHLTAFGKTQLYFAVSL